MNGDITYIPGKYLDSVPEIARICFYSDRICVVDKLIGDRQVRVIMNDNKKYNTVHYSSLKQAVIYNGDAYMLNLIVSLNGSMTSLIAKVNSMSDKIDDIDRKVKYVYDKTD